MDENPKTPENIVAQLDAIMQMLDADPRDDLIVTDDAVQIMLDRLAYTCFLVPDDKDARWVVRRMGSALLWMFILGREHAAQGHQGPAFKPIVDESQIPDHLYRWYGLTPPARNDWTNGK